MFKMISLLVCSICLAILVGECGVRLTGVMKDRSDTFYQTDAVLHHRFIPGKTGSYISPKGEFSTEIAVNRLGLRDDEFPIEKPDGVDRILLLGDSFLAALEVPVEHTVGHQLEGILNKKRSSGEPTRYEVINTGHSSYSPILQYLYLNKYGMAMSPDVIIVCFAANDVTDDYKYGEMAEFDVTGLPVRVKGPAEPKVEYGLPVPFKEFFREHSKLYLLLRESWHLIRLRILGEPDWKNDQQQKHLRTNDLRSDPFAIFKQNLSHQEEKAWQATEHYLSGIVESCWNLGIPIILAVIPEPHQINDWEWRSGKQVWGFAPQEMIQHHAMQDRLRWFGERYDVPVIDPISEFQNASGDDVLFFDYDGHFTAYGHGVFAQVLYEAVVDFGGLVP